MPKDVQFYPSQNVLVRTEAVNVDKRLLIAEKTPQQVHSKLF